jgi:hypothetical protein
MLYASCVPDFHDQAFAKQTEAGHQVSGFCLLNFSFRNQFGADMKTNCPSELTGWIIRVGRAIPIPPKTNGKLPSGHASVSKAWICSRKEQFVSPKL